MPSLQVRDLPEHIYQTLCAEALHSHRSIAQQAIATLAQGLKIETAPVTRRKKLLESIRSERLLLPTAEFEDPAILVREDRDR